MKSKRVKQHGGLKIGDVVVMVPDQGFHEGKRYIKQIKGISLTYWTPDEQRRLNNPSVEVLYSFTDGELASGYSSVTKKESCPCAKCGKVTPWTKRCPSCGREFCSLCLRDTQGYCPVCTPASILREVTIHG